MAQEKENKTQPQQPQARPCPQDCRLCGFSQQVFCTTKMLFDLSRSQQMLHEQVNELSNTVNAIQEQMQPKETDGQLSIPFIEDGQKS